MGTSTGLPDFDWSFRDQIFTVPDPVPTDGGIRILAAIDPAFPRDGVQTGAAWCLIGDLSPAIPAGATITDISMTVGVQLSSATGNSPTVHQSPSLSFATLSEINLGGNPTGFGGFGAGGVGDLPMDTSLHQITYVNSVYNAAVGLGIFDMDGLVAAIGASDPLGMYVTAQNVADGQEMDYSSPWTLTVTWSAGPSVIPPLRQYPRSDGLGASSTKRVYPLPPSIQASNRRAGGYL